MSLEVRWLGRIAYPAAHARMAEALAQRLDGGPDVLLLCEHDPVYTLGRARGARGNLIDPGDTPIVEVERGGDVTFHGPGQLVGYPVVGLPPGRQDLRGFLRGLESVLIEVLAGFGLEAGRDARNTGVWLGGQKVASIGIAARRWVTWHGFALNLTTDLAYFRRIHPCGLDAALITRLADHLSPCPPMELVSERIAEAFVAWWAGWSNNSDLRLAEEPINQASVAAGYPAEPAPNVASGPLIFPNR